MGIRARLQHQFYQRQYWVGQSLLSSPSVLRWRLVGTGRLSTNLSPAAGLSTAVSTAEQCDHHSSRPTWLWQPAGISAESSWETGTPWQADSLHSRQYLRAAGHRGPRDEGLSAARTYSETLDEVAEQCLHRQGWKRLPPKQRRQVGQTRERQLDKAGSNNARDQTRHAPSSNESGDTANETWHTSYTDKSGYETCKTRTTEHSAGSDPHESAESFASGNATGADESGYETCKTRTTKYSACPCAVKSTAETSDAAHHATGAAACADAATT